MSFHLVHECRDWRPQGGEYGPDGRCDHRETVQVQVVIDRIADAWHQETERVLHSASGHFRQATCVYENGTGMTVYL